MRGEVTRVGEVGLEHNNQRLVRMQHLGCSAFEFLTACHRPPLYSPLYSPLPTRLLRSFVQKAFLCSALLHRPCLPVRLPSLCDEHVQTSLKTCRYYYFVCSQYLGLLRVRYYRNLAIHVALKSVIHNITQKNQSLLQCHFCVTSLLTWQNDFMKH